ncbi:hypothetical protein B0H63DRAFT_302890 [Podospora didyma]|uniref:Rhodopsin domain-containing protein n=1 Tax=Podospora didyma TaxID=330526 RepID=A0AAE0KAU6_9PEZI|nr:hypothetical protein B0H63DRAFT_302890 [Podospora didyma]
MWYLGGLPIVERNHGMVFALFFFTALALAIVSLRIYTRALVVRIVGPDDYVIILVMLGLIGYLTACMYQVKYGLGDAVRLADLVEFLRSLYVTIVLYNANQLLVKLSLILQYKRVFQTASTKRFFLGLLTFFTVYALIAMTLTIFTCWPIPYYWDESIEGGGKCLERDILHYTLAGFNIVIDFAILLIPLPFLRQLHIATRNKLILLGVFTCGFFTCIVSIVRLRSLALNFSGPIDQQPIIGVDIVLWSGLETSVATICASIPALQALLLKLFPSLKSRTGTGSRSTPRRSKPGRVNTPTPMLPLHNFISRKSGGRNIESALDTHFDNAEDPSSGKLAGIKIRRSVELKMVAARYGDNESESELVGNTTMWRSDCYADAEMGTISGADTPGGATTSRTSSNNGGEKGIEVVTVSQR